MIDVIFTF